MDTPERPLLASSSSLSSEAIIGSGIAVAALGVLCLLLGSAQWMRMEREQAVIWLAVAALLIVAGAITAMMGHSRKAR